MIIDTMVSKAPNKIDIVKRFMDNFNLDKKKILDVGGTKDYYDVLKSVFEPGKVYILNYDESQLINVDNSFVQDATKLMFENNSWDIVTSFDVIEHLNNPDDLLSECYRVLKEEGLLIISSPNLADFFSRITFLFGYVPFFYTPSKYRVGTPFSKEGPIMYHKSVFTFKAFKNYYRFIIFPSSNHLVIHIQMNFI